MPNCKENKKDTDIWFLAGGTVCPAVAYLMTGDFIPCFCFSPLLHPHLTPGFLTVATVAALCAHLKEGDTSSGNNVSGCTWLESH